MADITLKQHKIIAAKAREYLLNLHDSAIYPYAAYGLHECNMTSGTAERICQAKRASEQTRKELDLICALFDLTVKVVTDEIGINVWKIKVPIQHIELVDESGETVITAELPWKEKQLLNQENN